MGQAQKALMECTKYGNAILVVSSNLEPERWLEMNQQRLTGNPAVLRSSHRGGWFEMVKEELEVH